MLYIMSDEIVCVHYVHLWSVPHRIAIQIEIRLISLAIPAHSVGHTRARDELYGEICLTANLQIHFLSVLCGLYALCLLFVRRPKYCIFVGLECWNSVCPLCPFLE